ncbi:beta-ketoacyl synthase N-terminal-like domain-containing protein [Flavobacterium aquatile]|uniref:Beta-ketoacyl synthase n=1 Tax=Flavobacterium aquatile LMG 4008 = ATCC 11947 TaxID=1453498 RepID=A0A095SWL9_9FLAO|nr:beta-ketoacyl synthase N-terminal-like domain-containing protein [Flavobacterium aquatile]KGD68972.1 beta-ketoacyl synthase [Flavobacterium aquatile LMG 4008 = ATCC 11947]OXA65912.1 beta-ketoacyl synthase [Flavobacterium aquatile] [Flavobacterium aquatile LMG 4008 = ATCC 11947]
MKTKIAITSLASISPLGKNPDAIWHNYLSNKSLISTKEFNGSTQFVATIPKEIRQEIEDLRKSEIKYKALDETVLLSILVSRQAIKNAGWKNGDDFGINIGSSRGATQLFEKHHQEFLETGKTATLASPTTTLGNISSWVAHDLKNNGPEISHSITCSTALHAVLNAVAWLQSGMATKFLVGGSEAPLTAFTIAQMNALKIYSKEESEFPCRAFDFTKTKNSMVLGEGASVACLEIGENLNALAYIEGIGYATDDIEHNISISDEANCFQKSMKMALQNTNLEDVDAIVMHMPGTLKGDTSEYKAIVKTFGESHPMLTTNKWKVGHTFGASGMLNMELAILMMQHNHFIEVPFAEKQTIRKDIKKVLINAVGFGGNAVSILVSKEF